MARPYITSIEHLARREGREEGLREGLLEAIRHAPKVKFGRRDTKLFLEDIREHLE